MDSEQLDPAIDMCFHMGGSAVSRISRNPANSKIRGTVQRRGCLDTWMSVKDGTLRPWKENWMT